MFTKVFITILLLFYFCDVIDSKYVKNIKLNNKRKKIFELDDNLDYEVVLLPIFNENRFESEEVLFKLEVFGRVLNLKLVKNNLISQNFKSYIQNGNNSFPLPPLNKSCLLMGSKNEIAASIFYCKPKSFSGFIFLDDITLEISPISSESNEILTETNQNSKDIPHVIRKHSHFNKNKLFQQSALTNEITETFTLEVSIFFDEFAYNIFAPYLSYDDAKIRDMLLAYLNGVQALYHHPSLKGYVDIVIVRLDILKTQPENLPIYNGESGSLLKSFCSYQKELNVNDDSNPNHWDMGLYISGLDFFTYDNKGYKDYGIMGLSTVGGVCYEKFSCVIAEFGSTDAFGKPYPTAGFGSVYILAHEIGHNLGMHHDGTKNTCLPNGFIMSASRGTSGETQWSSCSADVMEKLKKKKCLQDVGLTTFDHSKFFETPGRLYSPKKQCELFLSNEKSYAVEDQSEICQTLKCTLPGKAEIYSSGPPLDGTKCDENKQCYAGECLKSTNNYPNTRTKIWNIKECESGCITNSMGYQINKGDSRLCDDVDICPKRISITDYASKKCKYFSRILTEIDSKGNGLQRSHNLDSPSLACTIFCRNKNGTFNIPKIQLNKMESVPHFPDGTWCHRENSIDFYCINNMCLSEVNFNRDNENGSDQNEIISGELKESIPFFNPTKKYSYNEEYLIDYLLLPN
ncbi:A disintegrin and metalloproteinase with thrombospondin motifs adt-1-like [Onthophagus taurus]|uniref:A disintegrin and metalloproteinase with thrombospondin motifs adt-1-like n=1 Tax=Onthophagus taurus TaxID=166361 RepID=UPI0039BE40F0